MRNALLTAITLLACTACGGAGQEESAPYSPPSSVDSQVADVVHPNAYELESTVQRYGLTPEMIDDIEIVRKIKPEEWNDLNRQCMIDFGFPVSTEGEIGAVPEDQYQALGLAEYSCLYMYPTDDIYNTPYGEPELRRYYDHWRDMTIPCLTDNGYASNDLPSFEVFRATAGTEKEFYPNAEEPLSERWIHAEEVCITLPSADYIRGLADTP